MNSTNQKPGIYYALQSRKFWSAVIGLIAILYVAYTSGAALDPDTVVNAIMGIVAAYMASVAFEDGMSKHSSGTTVQTDAPNVSVEAQGAKPGAPRP